MYSLTPWLSVLLSTEVCVPSLTRSKQSYLPGDYSALQHAALSCGSWGCNPSTNQQCPFQLTFHLSTVFWVIFPVYWKKLLSRNEPISSFAISPAPRAARTWCVQYQYPCSMGGLNYISPTLCFPAHRYSVNWSVPPPGNRFACTGGECCSCTQAACLLAEKQSTMCTESPLPAAE